MSEGKMKGSYFYSTASFILMWFLVQSVNSFRLRKTERRERHHEDFASQTAYSQEGVILFGRAFEKGTGLELEVVNWTKQTSSNSSEEYELAYQADSPPYKNPPEINPKETAWNRMGPALHCSKDQMKFTATGPASSLLAVEQKRENAPPMPLSQVPPSCGYTIQRNSLALALLVPFDGCNVIQEGGSYILPMRWQGTPVSLWCPKPSDPTPPPTELPERIPNQMPQKLEAPQPVNYMQPPVQQSNPQQPATSTNDDGIKNMPVYSYVYFPWPVPATQPPPETTMKPSTKPPQVPQIPQVPQMPIIPLLPQVPQVPQMPNIPLLPQVPQVPQMPNIPLLPQVPQYPGFPKFPQVPQGPLIPQVPQMPNIPVVPQVPQYPGFPKFPQVPQVPPVPRWPGLPIYPFPQMLPVSPFHHGKFISLPAAPMTTTQPPTTTTTAEPTTTTAEPTTTKAVTPVPQNPPNIPYIHPYYYPYLFNFPVPNTKLSK